jgi:membrane protein YdbS with pleckstrin-like domain
MPDRNMNFLNRKHPLESEPILEIGDTEPLGTTDNEAGPIPFPAGDTIEISNQFWALDPRNIRLERIGGLIFSTVVLVAVMIGLGILWFNIGFHMIWYGIAGGATVLIGTSFLLAHYWPAVVHRHASWRLDEEGLEIRRGVFWRHQITIPLGRVQHADVSQGPLQRMFELGTLTVHTAGTQNASVGLEGLTHSIAISLRDQIVRQRKDQNVV